MKKCPFCAEDIQDEAIKCRFCNEFLDGRPPQTQNPPAASKPKWYYKSSSLFIGFLVVGPLIIPLIWINPRYSQTKKIVYTAICIIVTIIAIKMTMASLASISKTYELLWDI